MYLGEDDVGEPRLTYWKPTPKPPPASLPTFTARAPPFPGGQSYPPPFQSLPDRTATFQCHQASGFYYPVNDAVHSYIQNQQIGLSSASLGYEGERRRMAQGLQVNAETLLMALSSEQNNQMLTDSLIHEEVTRAAKTLFSKRNRTLMHWLKPDVSKNQLKIDVNAAWNDLPAAEKVFYISQVLGKFAPHTTSLMVNPQLGPVKQRNVRVQAVNHENSEVDSTRVKQETPEAKVRKPRVKTKQERKPQKRKMEYSSDDNASCDSGLVMDIDQLTPESTTEAELPKKKRKYTKRKQKEKIKVEKKEVENSCILPVKISDIKQEPNAEPADPVAPKVKRKYVKRKLVRKKYKKREPKNKLINNDPMEMTSSSEPTTEQVADTTEDMDIWNEIANDPDIAKDIEEFKLLSEEVDSFWDSIDDPNSLFLELEIEGDILS